MVQVPVAERFPVERLALVVAADRAEYHHRIDERRDEDTQRELAEPVLEEGAQHSRRELACRPEEAARTVRVPTLATSSCSLRAPCPLTVCAPSPIR